MSVLSRRDFLALSTSAAVVGLAAPAGAAMGPNDKYDLVIRGGEVLDPSQSLRARRDIGIRWGVIETVQEAIPAERALKSIDASGKLVMPGLIDLHSHVYPYGSAIGIPADELVQFQATTTVVSAGDAGVNNLAALRRFIVAQTRARMYAFVHIANNGLSAFPVAELYNIDVAQTEACAMALAENADFLLGVKVRMSENVIYKHGLEPLKRGIQACEMCGWPAKMMVHIGGVESKELMSQILDLLRPGDVLTHAYSGAPNMSNVFTNIVQEGKLLPAALAAKQRGVIFDVGHGGGSFDFTVAEVAIPGGCTPDTISSDIHVFSGNSPGIPFLPNVMSKFMKLGFTLEQVVAMATTAPAKIINRAPKIGTLQVGAPGDVAIMELVEGPVSFLDTRNNKRDGKAQLKPVQTVINGVPFGRPYQAPFAVR
ncbi:MULTISPECIES: amidohydrolase family protein [Bradyrhizobium]|uniref:Dihydroorotase n=1 Tax=Bradyrhizobium ottawaense TaxID=931866 RepID=A0ABV4G3C7_9BRAD|nr:MULTISPECIES: amidohydrolase/deacetylase family metallohydrolase [Bradyrhizobium]MBR1288404.1 amidohydrolase/deacetylase family metallohydrolase [Bradyrhizobium ottawaense]MDA9482733.1 amidohydrolase [Bradyrhizobium sp. CCBAU 11445]WLB49508.1 amidohydrolase/deacetylase family metallohydrolase [Bradyrhizobium ottawaense]WQN79546.1 amidohydrolase/deacetylase family metallohydrolase [Bradyrhizobium ottawaense]BBO05826.1 amidohydrolase [Bradyrhizobium ottawaense]